MATISQRNSNAEAARRKRTITYGKASRNAAAGVRLQEITAKETDKRPIATRDLALDKTAHSRPLTAKRAPSQKLGPKPTPLAANSIFDIESSEEEHGTSRQVVASPRRQEKLATAQYSTDVADSKFTQERILPVLQITGSSPQRKRKRSEGTPNTTSCLTNSPSLASEAHKSQTQKVEKSRVRSLAKVRSGHVGTGPAQLPESAHQRLQSAKGVSSPARLARLINELNEATDLEHDNISLRTPERNHPMNANTPKADQRERPSLKRSASTTPRQAQLWTQLLVDETNLTPFVSPKPSDFSRRRSEISEHRSSEKSSRPQSLAVPAAGASKPRLIDKLRPNLNLLESFSDEDDEDYEDDERTDDNETALTGHGNGDSDYMETTTTTAIKVAIPPVQDFVDAEDSDQPPHALSQVSASDSQRRDQLSVNSQGVSGPRVTYSRTRSYLQEDTLEDNLLSALPVPAQYPASTRARPAFPTTVARKSAVAELHDDSDEDTNHGIRSIHELRAAGNKKRFIDENETLFDDIKDHKAVSRARRRSAMMELATKLADKAYANRFLEQEFDRILFEEFDASEDDVVADISLYLALARMIVSEPTERFLRRLPYKLVFDQMTKRLDDNRSLAKLAKERRSNMSKAAQSTFLEFAESMQNTDVWIGQLPTTITVQLIVLRTLDLLVPKLRNRKLADPVLTPSTIAALVSLVDSAASHTGDEDTHIVDQQNVNVRSALSILESVSVIEPPSHATTLWPAKSLTQLATTLPSILPRSDGCAALLLRLCLNLTNNHAENCNLFARENVVESLLQSITKGFEELYSDANRADDISKLDFLLLALGLFINLAEYSISICEQAAKLNDGSDLETLVEAFVRAREKAGETESEEEAHGNVAYGYLAVLLGNICQDDEAREVTRSKMPKKQLQVLADAVTEFVHFHQKVDESQASAGEEGHDDMWSRFTERLMAVVERLRGNES